MMELVLIDIISMAPTEESENSVDTADVRTHTETERKVSEWHV